MKNKKWLYVLVGMIMMGMTGLTHPQQSEAAELKIVFFSSMWGAAIGGVAGSAQHQGSSGKGGLQFAPSFTSHATRPLTVRVNA